MAKVKKYQQGSCQKLHKSIEKLFKGDRREKSIGQKRMGLHETTTQQVRMAQRYRTATVSEAQKLLHPPGLHHEATPAPSR